MRRVACEQAERILDFLCTRLLSGKKEQDRETANIALKTVINEISDPKLSDLVVKNVVPKLLQGMQSKVAHPALKELLFATGEKLSDWFAGIINSFTKTHCHRSTLTWPLPAWTS